MHLKAQVRCLSKRKSLLVGSFVVDCRWSKGSLIQFLLGINTLMNSFRNVFLLFKKKFHQRHKSAKGKALKRDDYHLSNTFLPRTEELRYLSHVHNREVSKLKRDRNVWQRGGCYERSVQRETSQGLHSRWALYRDRRRGERAREGRNETTKKAGDMVGPWHMSHCGGGILFTWPLVCHRVTSPVMSLHPVRLRCIVLCCTWTSE